MVERFGTLELVLSKSNHTGLYKDVYHLKDKKKKPFQAKIWRPETKDHINLGTFRSPGLFPIFPLSCVPRVLRLQSMIGVKFTQWCATDSLLKT